MPRIYAKVPGAGFEPATSGPFLLVWSSPDYESGAQTRLGYPGFKLALLKEILRVIINNSVQIQSLMRMKFHQESGEFLRCFYLPQLIYYYDGCC